MLNGFFNDLTQINF